MRKSTATAGSALFFAIAPGVVAGLVPWWLTGWRVRGPLTHWATVRVTGLVMLVTGAIVLIHAFARFVAEGHGTPAPAAPAEHLVIGGLYRYVRNPMYLAVVATITGQAFALGQPILLVHAAAVWVTTAAFAHWYEEPALARQFGAQYETYRRNVPAWRPRARPWQQSPLNGNAPAHVMRSPTGCAPGRLQAAVPRPVTKPIRAVSPPSE